MTRADGNAQGLPAVSNEQFLRTLFGNAWHRAHVTSFAGDPSDPALDRGSWTGGAAGHWIIDPDLNNYYAVSLVNGRRRQEDFEALVVLGADDVGVKVDGDTLRTLLGDPTYRIETSSGNEHWGYALATPIRELSQANA